MPWEAELGPRDLLRQVRGVSINPVDVTDREFMKPEGPYRFPGFDAACGVEDAINYRNPLNEEMFGLAL